MGQAVAWKALAAKVAAYFAEHTVVAFFAKLAASVLLQVGINKLFGPKQPKFGLTGAQVMTRGGLEYRKAVYGKAMVSGAVVYNNLAGSSGEYLWFVISLTGHESDSFEAIWFDGDSIPVADIDWTPSASASDGTGTGDVSTAKWVGDNSTAGARIFYYLGRSDQPVNGVLNIAFSDITTNFRLRGVTHVVVSMLYDEDTAEVWRGGAPRDIKALVKGRKIYDPRLDSTNGGSGTHRYATASTWEWSDNPALCVADYLMNYMGVSASTSINWTSIADAADDCDGLVVVSLTGGSFLETALSTTSFDLDSLDFGTASSTEKRFTCNGVVSMGSTHKDNLDILVSSMGGRLAYSSGVWKLRASMWEASSVSYTTSDLAGDIEVQGSSPRSDRFNTIRGFFVDPSRKYEAAEFPHINDSTYITRDNSEVISFDLQLPCTNSETMAQRLAYRLLEQGDNQITVKLRLNARGAKAAVGDVIDFTFDEFSWTAKTFRVIEWSRMADGSYSLGLREDSSGRYDDPAVSDYGTALASDITVPADAIPAPSALAASAVANGIQLTWTVPPPNLYDVIDIYESVDNTWANAVQVAQVAAGTDIYVAVHDPAESFFYWIRARRLPALESIRNPDSDTSTITATAASVPPLGALSLGNWVVSADDVSGTVTATFYVDNDGDYYELESDSGFGKDQIGTWLSLLTNADYECRLTKVSGTDPTGSALATWLVCSTDRTWTIERSTVGFTTFAGTMEIRRVSDDAVLVNFDLTIQANRD